MLSPQKTLQGISAGQVGGEAETPSRQAMPEAVFEAGGDADARLPLHRPVVAPAPRGRGREGLSLEWTDAPQERGPKMGGGKKAWDHVERRLAPSPTSVTAVLTPRERLDGIAVVVQPPAWHAEEGADWQATVQERSAHMEAARGRVLALFHHLRHRLGSTKRTEMALEVVQHLAQEGPFPQAHEAVDHGGLTLELPRGLERVGQQWVREVAGSRPLQGQGPWRRVAAGAAEWRREHPDSFRPVRVRCRHGETQALWVLTKGVRRKR